jgi:hypothetical protein
MKSTSYLKAMLRRYDTVVQGLVWQQRLLPQLLLAKAVVVVLLGCCSR